MIGNGEMICVLVEQLDTVGFLAFLDSGRTLFDQLLEIFFVIHDPTTLNRQGNDVGTQYRSVIFYHSEAQKEASAQIISEIESDRPVVTAIEPASTFYVAEQYHQRYFEKNPHQGYCMFVVGPKVDKFRAKFASRMKK